MKKIGINFGLIVMLFVGLGAYAKLYGNPFWSDEEKHYHVGKALAKTLAKYDGVKFADKPTFYTYDETVGKWRMGITMTVKNGFGVSENVFVVVEFSKAKTDASIMKPEDWELDGYAYGDEYFGSLVRFKDRGL